MFRFECQRLYKFLNPGRVVWLQSFPVPFVYHEILIFTQIFEEHKNNKSSLFILVLSLSACHEVL